MSNYQGGPIKEQIITNSSTVKRTLFITGLALINAILVGFIAKGLVLLINFVTSIFFYGDFSFGEVSLANHQLGALVIAIPVIGGLIVGLMARFGSPAIRGHGIPEAMEKIARGESKIHPFITILKPLSAAISIGTGGPFGAEGPIISTGGALGSFCGQTLRITSQERKVLLAAGATAGMTAIFGTPFAAILLAVELLLFEFSGRSFIPVMIACVTGACMHFLLFGLEPTFPMPEIQQPRIESLFLYSTIGLIIGFAAIVVTKSVYFIEDAFEKLPFHWMWWPALGGLGVGIIGVIAPTTLGVGYQNITNTLSGSLPLTILISLCFWKFLSWAIALGSGTSGGTLAPLLTIGSSIGALLGLLSQNLFPEIPVSIPLAALVGMAALFAGAARALLTSIVFAMETTMQESTLLPLIAGCVTAYMVSFVFMRTTIMTEKIHRRGIRLPESYHPDLLEIHTVEDVLAQRSEEPLPSFKPSLTLTELKNWILTDGLNYRYENLIVVSEDGQSLLGAINKRVVVETTYDSLVVADVQLTKLYTIYSDNTLQLAVEFMLKTDQDVLPVLDRHSKKLVSIISERDILNIFEQRFRDETHKERHINLWQSKKRIFSVGKKLFQKRLVI